MAPTAEVLTFGTPKTPAPTEPSKKQISKWKITGNVKSSEFQKAVALAQVILIDKLASQSDPGYFQFEFSKHNPFEYSFWRTTKRLEYPGLVQNLFPNCVIECEGKAYRADEFYQLLNQKYDIPNLPLNNYVDVGAFEFEKSMKETLVP